MTTFVITGLAVEARIARRAGLPTVVAGGTTEQRADCVAKAVAKGASGLISFGIAGGLHPKLAPGTVLLPELVQTEAGETFATDEGWRRRLLAHIPGAAGGTIYSAETVLGAAAEKKAVFGRTRAVAVDMESAAVARAAAAAGIPFVVLRTVADPAHRSLPKAAMAGLTAEGRVAIGAVVGHLARRPHQAPALLMIALQTRRALSAIYSVVEPVDGFHAIPLKSAAAPSA